MALFVLHETAAGYALFEKLQAEEIGATLDAVQRALLDISRFGRVVKLTSFLPFHGAAEALENANDVSEGIVNASLQAFLELNLPKRATLGVADKALGSALARLGVACESSELVLELLRGIRLHGDKLLGALQAGDTAKAQLGLGHSYSRAKVRFNVHRNDNMIIQAIALLDQIDKDINTFAMRIREWYSWHFPELYRLVPDNVAFAKCVLVVPNKSTLSAESAASLEKTIDTETASAVLAAAKSSMGSDVSEIDMLNIQNFARQVVDLAKYRAELHEYLREKMGAVAPNLGALVGEMVGARLISHAGSLTNLSKCPASTVQILGAEKALFRALKTKSNTPKYGLLYHSSFIGRAAAKNKGRVSRFLANKCAIASRLDNFSDEPTEKYGIALKAQVEERLKFYESGGALSKNADVMARVNSEIQGEKKDKKEKKRVAEETPEKDSKKSKKFDKKSKSEIALVEEAVEKSEKKSKKDSEKTLQKESKKDSEKTLQKESKTPQKEPKMESKKDSEKKTKSKK